MALTELQEQKYAIIEQRLGETESAQSQIDWAVWAPRIAGAAVFSLLMIAVLLAP